MFQALKFLFSISYIFSVSMGRWMITFLGISLYKDSIYKSFYIKEVNRLHGI